MSEAELDKFRREWQEEVQRRDQKGSKAQQSRHIEIDPQPSSSGQPERARPSIPRAVLEDDRIAGGGWDFDNLEVREASHKLEESGEGVHPETTRKREPKTALDYYECAVESETQGRLGESVAYYRHAFRLNDHVDQQYRNKHFPPTAFTTQTKASKSKDAVSGSLHHSHSSSTQSEGISTLIESFASEPIIGALPLIENDIPPSCPITHIPYELLTQILYFCAFTDIASFVRLSLVSKRFAYLVATETSIWMQLCRKSKFGFSAMHFDFACSLHGTPIAAEILPDFERLTTLERSNSSNSPQNTVSIGETLMLSDLYPSFMDMIHYRPRLRFTGVYISTVNYVRPGASSPTQITWNSPVHIVTYYRYLRFYRDGSCISLLTTVEPLEVVPHLHAEHIGEHAGAMASPGLSAVAKYSLRGRWRMSSLSPLPNVPNTIRSEDENAEPEGNVHIETYGVAPQLIYHMQLALRSNSGKGAKNTKLVWRGFWSYNNITDDWAEFGLRNDRAYVWSRVKSWSDV